MANPCEKRTSSKGSEVALRGCDYAYAIRCARIANSRGRNVHKYNLAHRSVFVVFRRRSKEQGQDLARLFREQVNLWKDQTGHLSSVTRAIAHPTYLRIIGLAKYSSGHEIERLLLQELESEPDHWFAALNAVTGEDPVKPEQDFDEAVSAWLAWGRRKRIIYCSHIK